MELLLQLLKRDVRLPRGRQHRRGRRTSAPTPLTRLLRLESLEGRLLLSGESITPALGDIPAGASVTTQFDVTVDAAFPKGDVLVQN
jgi:hypothetical protein